MGSAYATAPVIFSDHPLATDIPELVYNPFGLEGQLTGSGGRWTDGIWMLHGKTPYDIIAVLADIGWVVWSNSDYKYPIVSAKAVHTHNLWGEFTTTLCKDLDFTNDRTKAWITGEYGFVDSFPETGWDCVVYLSGPEIERDSWQKRCILEYILEQCEDVETMGDFVAKDGKVGIAVQYSNNPSHEGSTKTSALEKAIGDALSEDFLIYQSTRQNDFNTIEFLRSTDFDVEVEAKQDKN